jgi:drug/metabolite transporter (DMT)-like permease
MNSSEFHSKGYLAALASAAILSTTAILIRYLTQTYQMPALILAFWRDVFVTLTLLLGLARFKAGLLSISKRHVPFFATFGLVLAAFNALWTLSVALNGAAISTVLVYSSTAFTAILGRWFLGERLNWARVMVISMTLGGCALVAEAYDSLAWQGNPLGIFTGIVSGLGFAAYSLMGRTASRRNLNPWTTLLYTFGFAALFLLLINALPFNLPGKAQQFSELLWLGRAWGGWGILILLAAGPTVVGFGLYNISLGYLPSNVANLILTLEPAFTALIAYFFLSERLTGLQITGSLVIMAGVVFLRVSEGREDSIPKERSASQELPS